jgi:PAS domain-containing protein
VIVIETISKTEQQLFPEVEALRTKLDATDRRLQEANEILQVQIAERKRDEETFEKAQKYAESIVERIREPLWALTVGLKVTTANRPFYETFQAAPKETEGRFIFDVGNHPWDIPALREPLEEIIPQNTHFSNFEVDHAFPRIGRKRVLLNARRISGR